MSQCLLSQPLSPRERYERDLQRPDFRHDPAQARAVEHLQSLYEQLVAAWKEEQKQSFWGGLLRRFSNGEHEPVRGLYFWGGVGRGKTYLMDNFYESLPFAQKMRSHFHRFMRRVHAELKKLDGQKNPLQRVADIIASEARVICFDEFFVSDITDAMILGTLMEALFARGVTLVATSNIVPDGLYKDGLQRARFLPAIDLLNKHTLVVNVDGGVDYRLRALEQAQLYYTPLGTDADVALKACFDSLVPATSEVRERVDLEVEGRLILARYLAEDVVWFDFVELCDGPRSQNDYIELACEYQTVLLSNVPALGREKDDQARRFINLVDEFYDRQVKLVISAERPLAEIYSTGKLEFEFQRTVSRLLEMQSREYLARPHRPE
ncbi:Predicted ATPase [Cellvibrio japonicus Ueda107]|uniref:Cell division protein ZapE n=1 Tax=Cellvibrio japonicus (strain Ueda107) TaxID=498211 RepID=B3PBM1_CELJU|nr:Predicted ATPase [Cellvibrio japonicus Ueda107]